MALFGSPDIDKLKARRDIKGLLGALKYKNDPAVRKNAALALAELADRLPPASLSIAIAPLIAAFNDTELSVLPAVVQALSAIGQPAVLPLISALRATPDRVREGSARCLGRIGASLTEPAYLRLPIDPLVGALKDSSYLVRRSAAWALGRIGPRLDLAQ